MSNTEHKIMIQKGFDTVASGYDLPSLFWFPETAKRMIEHLSLNNDEQLLDVCCGTGWVALEAAAALPQGKVVGIDLSAGMLEQARSKAADRKIQNANFQQMDLDKLTFPKKSFDIASCSFGLFFMDDMTQALKNISSVVKEGGKIVLSTFTGDAFLPMSDMFLDCYRSFGKDIDGLSWKRLSTHALIEEQFNAVGIHKIKIHHEALGCQMTNANMWWEIVWNAGYRSLLNQLSDAQQAEFKQKHMADIQALLGEDGVWFNTEVLIAVGEK